MTAIFYMSSTFEDLYAHREAVYGALRRLPIDLIAMKDYAAMDKRPLQKYLEEFNLALAN